MAKDKITLTAEEHKELLDTIESLKQKLSDTIANNAGLEEGQIVVDGAAFASMQETLEAQAEEITALKAGPAADNDGGTVDPDISMSEHTENLVKQLPRKDQDLIGRAAYRAAVQLKLRKAELLSWKLKDDSTVVVLHTHSHLGTRKVEVPHKEEKPKATKS